MKSKAKNLIQSNRMGGSRTDPEFSRWRGPQFIIWINSRKFYKTRKHCSRMCAVRSSSRPGEGCLSGGVCPGGVCLGGVCLATGLCAWMGGPARGCLPRGWGCLLRGVSATGCGVCPGGGVCLGGCLPRVVCQTLPCEQTTVKTIPCRNLIQSNSSQQAGSTHPTGMSSCYDVNV